MAKGLLTDGSLRSRLLQVLFKDGEISWDRLANLVDLAQEGGDGLDVTDTISDFIRVVARDRELRSQLVAAATANNRIEVGEIQDLVLKGGQLVDTQRLVNELVTELPSLAAYFALDLSKAIIAPVPAPFKNKRRF